MSVLGYTRVSTTEQAADDRSSLDTQRRKILAAAEMAGMTVDEFIEEPGVSGSKPLADRPEGGPLLARLVKGDVLIVAKLDRAFRNAADALATAERLKARKIDLIVADMGFEPVTQNGVSRMFFGMLALVAEFERDRIKERSAEGRMAKRRWWTHRRISAVRLPQDRHRPGGPVGTGPAQQAALADMRRLAAEGLAASAPSPRRYRSGMASRCRTSRSGPPWRGPDPGLVHRSGWRRPGWRRGKRRLIPETVSGSSPIKRRLGFMSCSTS